MITHIWSVLCARTVIDSETNNISLIDVLEQLNLKVEPVPDGKVGLVPIPYEVVSFWRRTRSNEPTQGRARLRLLAPDGKEIGPAHEVQLDLSAHPRLRSRARGLGIPVLVSGEYHFTVELQSEDGGTWDEVARIPLQVTIEPAEGAGPVTSA